jgi:hypothetical protein
MQQHPPPGSRTQAGRRLPAARATSCADRGCACGADVRRAVEATGGYLEPESAAWHFRGHTVLDGWDPEGNIVQFKQALDRAQD